MCYAIPGRVVELKGKEGNIAVVDYFGEHRNVLNEFSNSPHESRTKIRIGDYVYAQGGILIEKIPEKEALLILKTWKDRFFELKKLDFKISIGEKTNKIVGVIGGTELSKAKLSKTPLSKTDLSKTKPIKPKEANRKFLDIIKRAKQRIPLKKEDILELMKTENEDELNLLFKTANQLRRKYLKNSCCVHGIIEFSNHCHDDCHYCGIRKSNKALKRYRMSIDEIVETAEYAVNQLGFKALVLQSGDDLWYTPEKLSEIIKKIKKRCGVLLFMSIGDRDFECYKKMYEAGARGILLRFETSNQKLYKSIHSGPKADYQKRIALLEYSNKLGYIIATGSLIGLPGQSREDLVNDILLAVSLNAEMLSFGPFIPHPQTPMADAERAAEKTAKKSADDNLTKASENTQEKINTALKTIAVSRLVNPNAKILVTTALETLDRENGARLGLLSGANSLMINLTHPEYKKLYSIYPNKAGDEKIMENIKADENIVTKKNIKRVLKLLYSLGRAPTDLGM